MVPDRICLRLQGTWVGLESLASAFISPVVAYLSQDVTTQPTSKYKNGFDEPLFALRFTVLSPCLVYFGRNDTTLRVHHSRFGTFRDGSDRLCVRRSLGSCRTARLWRT